MSKNKSTEFCKDCGAEIPRDSKFCKICGAKLVKVEYPAAEENKDTPASKSPPKCKACGREMTLLDEDVQLWYCYKDENIFLAKENRWVEKYPKAQVPSVNVFQNEIGIIMLFAGVFLALAGWMGLMGYSVSDTFILIWAELLFAGVALVVGGVTAMRSSTRDAGVTHKINRAVRTSLKLPKTTMHCTQCGAVIPRNSKFCKDCGSSQL